MRNRDKRRLIHIFLFNLYGLFLVPVLAGFEKPEAFEGILNLTTVDIENEGPVDLDGQWEFYWNTFIPAEGIIENSPSVKAGFTDYIDMPDIWNGYRLEGEKLGGNGYASYRLILIADIKEGDEYAFLLPDIYTAGRLFVNGRELLEAGKAGKSKSETVPQWKRSIVTWEAEKGPVEIVLHISNFHHRKGGITDTVSFGLAEQLRAEHNRRVNFEYFIVGSLLIMLLYHFGLFLLRPKEKAPLFFALFCLLITVRLFITGESYIIPPEGVFYWNFFLKIEYLTIYLGIPVFALFTNSIFPEEFRNPYLHIILTVASLASVLVIFTPARIFSHSLPVMQIFLVAASGYLFYSIIQAIGRRHSGSVLFLIGFAAFFITIINDLLYNNQFIQTGLFAPFGLFIFVLFHALILSLRFSQTFSRVEELLVIKQQLELANDTLKGLSIMDSLTRISNRRHFDDIYRLEWSRAVRSSSSLALLMIDIDFFKPYNDNYGHQAGDGCLRQVAATLQSSLKRSIDFIARYGGEEFAVILPETDIEGAEIVAEMLRQNVEDEEIPHEFSSVAPVITISIGVAAILPSSEEEPEKLIKRADMALYRAKQSGRNQVRSYKEE